MLVMGGIALILAGMIFGDIFAAFILHPNADRIGASLLQAANGVAQHDRAAQAFPRLRARHAPFNSAKESKFSHHSAPVMRAGLAKVKSSATRWKIVEPKLMRTCTSLPSATSRLRWPCCNPWWPSVRLQSGGWRCCF